MDKAIYISYYTDSYREEVKTLESSLIKYELPHHIYHVKDTGSWVRNCALKSVMIRRAMKHYNKPVVFLDADAEVVGYPELFNTLDCDIAAHRTASGELLSGTLYVSDLHIINQWIYEQSKSLDVWDQKVLDSVLKTYTGRFCNLPQSYTKIFDSDGPEAIIKHNQASRRLKHMSDLYPKDMNVRLLQDGTFIVNRARPEDLKLLNDSYTKVPGANRWYTRVSKQLDVSSLLINSDEAYLIGKGPSLDKIKLGDFKTDLPIFCINESVHKIVKLGVTNPIYTLQQDVKLGTTCYNKKAKLLINRHAVTPELESKLHKVYTPGNYNCRANHLTVVVGLKIIESLGLSTVNMLGFDASLNKNVAYAKCIGYASSEGGDPKRFLTHRVLIENATDLELVWPVKDSNSLAPASSDDKPLL